MTGDARHRHRRRDAEEDQERRPSKPPPMPNMPEMNPTASPMARIRKMLTGRSAIGRRISARARVRRLAAENQVPRRATHLRRRHAGEADRVSTGFAARHPAWRPTKSRQQAAKPTCANSWHRRRRRDAPRMGLRLGTQRVGEGILPVLARAGTSRRAIYCAGRGIDKSNLAPAAGGLRLGAGAAGGGRVPAAGRRLDLRGRLRLHGSGPSLQHGPRGRQRSFIETGAHVVALLGGFTVALAGGQGEPPIGFRQVLLHPMPRA